MPDKFDKLYGVYIMTYLATFMSATTLMWIMGKLLTIITEGESNIYHWVGFISTAAIFVAFLLAFKKRHDP